MANDVGTMLGKYLLLKKIESGGMGEIFIAKVFGPVGFDKFVVIKRILAKHLDNQQYLDMFFNEARIAAKLSHSNIVQLYDMGQVGDSYFHAMEYIQGKSLREIIDRSRTLGEHLHPAHIVSIISAVAAGMSYAHNLKDINGKPLKIIHRDINPYNIMISYNGEVKLIDFGIAKSEVSTHKTETGTLKGKFVYMSPEQSAAEELDKRSDIFSLGICMYETLTYQNPFAKANIVLSLEAIQKEQPALVSSSHSRYGVFDSIIQKALAKNPENRYSDANELRNDLQRLLLSGEIKQAPINLSKYLHEIFEQQIEFEQEELVTLKKLEEEIQRSDAAGSAEIPASSILGATTEKVVLPNTIDAAYLEDKYRRRSRKLQIFIIVLALLMIGFAGSIFILKVVKPIPVQVTKQLPISEDDKQMKSKGSQKSTSQQGEISKRKEKEVAVTSKSSPKQELTKDDVVKVRKVTEIEEVVLHGKNTNNKHKTVAHKPVMQQKAIEKTKAMLLVNTQPITQVKLENSYVGQPPNLQIALKQQQGIMEIGSPDSGFTVTINYKLVKNSITYTLSSSPWSIITHNGISIGRSPIKRLKVGLDGQRFTFKKPGLDKELLIVLRFKPL